MCYALFKQHNKHMYETLNESSYEPAFQLTITKKDEYVENMYPGIRLRVAMLLSSYGWTWP